MGWHEKAEDKFWEFIGICVVSFVVFLFGFDPLIGFTVSGVLAFLVFLALMFAFVGLTKKE